LACFLLLGVSLEAMPLLRRIFQGGISIEETKIKREGALKIFLAAPLEGSAEACFESTTIRKLA
jgi:hypothetical protein